MSEPEIEETAESLALISALIILGQAALTKCGSKETGWEWGGQSGVVLREGCARSPGLPESQWLHL